MRQPVEEHHGHDPADAGIVAHLAQRPERIGAFQIEGPAVFLRQRFRQQEPCGDEIRHRQKPGPEKGNARPKLAEQPADHRPDSEADAEGNADQAEIAGTVLVIADIGDIGRASGETAAGNTGKQPPDDQHPETRGGSTDEIVERKREDRDKQDRPPPEAIRQIAEERRKDKLHRRIDDEQPPAIERRPAHILAGEFPQKGREDRHDDGDPDNIEDEDHENDEQTAADEFRIKGLRVRGSRA